VRPGYELSDVNIPLVTRVLLKARTMFFGAPKREEEYFERLRAHVELQLTLATPDMVH
jgi:hypothetical protein